MASITRAMKALSKIRRNGYSASAVTKYYGRPVAERKLPNGNLLFMHWYKGDSGLFLIVERKPDLSFVQERKPDTFGPAYRDCITFFNSLQSSFDPKIEADYLRPDGTIDGVRLFAKHPHLR